MEQAAELRKMATASGGQNVTGLGKTKNASAPVWEYFGFSLNDKAEQHSLPPPPAHHLRSAH